MTIVFIFFFSLIVKNYNCFNVDTNSPLVYVNPLQYSQQQPNYFGYSLALYPGNRTVKPWLFIGAPRGNDPNNAFENPGVCFKCGIKETCNFLKIFDNRPSNFQDFPKSHSWIGGSMDISYNHNRVVICAPRQIKLHKIHDQVDDYYIQGACYWFHVNDNTSKTLLPLNGNSDIVSVQNTPLYNFAHGQAGFSVHLPNSNEGELLLGAPGVLNWKGTSVLYEDIRNFDPIASRRIQLKKRSADFNEFGGKIIPDAKDNDEYGLLGYSSTSGYFFNKKQLHYASGAPRSHNYAGLVSIYTFNQDEGIKYLYGNQFGEYFGASLTSGDLNDDGYDDLIVGSPMYAAEKYNEGMIYVYLGGDGVSFAHPSFHMKGESANGQFGSCVQFLGDFNSDGFGDVAIAAPFEEEGSGVVYIYAGSKSGLNNQFYQRIVGKDISAEIRGFGISISRGADIDENDYPDLAIGAYLSGHVVVLRTSPIFSIKHKLSSFSSSVSHGQSEFKIQACFSSRGLVGRGIKIQRIINVDPELGRARLKNDNEIDTVLITSGGRVCQNFTIALEKSLKNNVDPVTVYLTHKFTENPKEKEVIYITEKKITGRDHFCSSCPLYDENKSSKLEKVEIPFALGCGSDNICDANLEFETRIKEIGEDHIFVLGSKKLLTLETLVKNLGEKAYLTELQFILPENVHLESIPPACMEHNQSSVSCLVANPLETNDQKQILLRLDMTTINEDKYNENDDYLQFVVIVSTKSRNKNIKNVKYAYLKFKREADVTISGKSGQQSYFYGDVQKPVQFIQSYQVEKFGSSILNEILIEISIPRSIKSKEHFITIESIGGQLDEREFSCTESSVDKKEISSEKNQSINLEKGDRSFGLNCENEDVVCSKLSCTAGPINSGEIATIKLKMSLHIKMIAKMLGKNDVIYFGTRGRVTVKNPSNFVQNGDEPDVAEVVSLFTGEEIEEQVAPWIIAVSVIASLIILGLFSYLLYKIGFFKRKTKDELEQLKNETENHENAALNDEN